MWYFWCCFARVLVDDFGFLIGFVVLVVLVLAGVEGFEPPTPGFGDRCSTAELHSFGGADLRLGSAMVRVVGFGCGWGRVLGGGLGGGWWVGIVCGGALERVKGIEPSFSAWKADVLPLNHTRSRSL